MALVVQDTLSLITGTAQGKAYRRMKAPGNSSWLTSLTAGSEPNRPKRQERLQRRLCHMVGSIVNVQK